MRVLHVMSERGAHGGGEIFALDTVLALQERGVEQFVICRPYDDYLQPLRNVGVPVQTFDFNKWNKWFQKRRVGRRILQGIKSHAPDVVHCWMPTAADWTPPGSGVPVLGWFGIRLDMKHFRNCDYHMGVTHELASWIGEKSGHPDRVFHGHTFVSLEEYPPLSREEFGIPDNKPVILMLARMSPAKGVDILLRAAVELDVFLLLAGGGNALKNHSNLARELGIESGEGHTLEDYRQLARDLGIESRVRFIGWRHDRSALLDLADILAVPSRFEGFPTVVPEAWSKNVPVVASKANGLGEYIDHGTNGMLSDIEDIDGLKDNIRAVLENAGLRGRLIAGGAGTYETKFSKQAVISSLLKTYEEIARRGVGS